MSQRPLRLFTRNARVTVLVQSLAQITDIMRHLELDFHKVGSLCSRQSAVLRFSLQTLLKTFYFNNYLGRSERESATSYVCFSHYIGCQSLFSHRCKIQVWLLSGAWTSETGWAHPNNKVSKVLVTWIENIIAYRFKKQNKTQSIWIKARYGCLDRDFSWSCTWWMRRTMNFCHKGLRRRWLWSFLPSRPLLSVELQRCKQITMLGFKGACPTSAFRVFHNCHVQPLHKAFDTNFDTNFVSVENYRIGCD